MAPQWHVPVTSIIFVILAPRFIRGSIGALNTRIGERALYKHQMHVDRFVDSNAGQMTPSRFRLVYHYLTGTSGTKIMCRPDPVLHWSGERDDN